MQRAIEILKYSVPNTEYAPFSNISNYVKHEEGNVMIWRVFVTEMIDNS